MIKVVLRMFLDNSGTKNNLKVEILQEEID